MSLAMDAAPSLSGFLAGRRRQVLLVCAVLALALPVVAVASLSSGAVSIPAGRTLAVIEGLLRGEDEILSSREALVMLNIRLPRLLLGGCIGAALAVSGALLQGLFRNPLADPGLVGVSSGAALAAAATIVLGDQLLGGTAARLPFAFLPAGAFLGGLLATTLLYAIATREGRTSIATMLLAGVALSALAASGTGLLAFISDDRQLRDLTFWSLGSLSGASWAKLSIIAPLLGLAFLAVPFLGRGLNALLLGEAEAYHLGVRVERLKRTAIVLVAVLVGASVASAGLIGFVGIVVPHLLRLVLGPDHRVLLPLSALGGAVLIIGADLLARTLVAPAELPIGILTALIGAPFFLWLLLSRARVLG